MTFSPGGPAATRRSPVEWRLRLQRAMQLPTRCGHTYFSGSLGPGSMLVDLGAHRGAFASEVCARHACRCIAVEPDAELFAAIPERDGLTKINAAICRDSGDVTLYRTIDSEAGSLIDTGQSEASRVRVAGRRLDDLLAENRIGRIDLLKIDIEGAEEMLFDSIKDRTLYDVSQITIEFHDHLVERTSIESIIRRLESLGFLYINFAGGPDHADCLFLNLRALISKGHFRPILYVLVLKSYFALRRRAPAEGIS